MEILDIINENDEIIGQAPQKEVYDKMHLHRIVHVLIFNVSGQMALQKRSQLKLYCPLHWSTTVGGHVQSGEDYQKAALREMVEETGLELPVEFLAKDVYEDPERPGLRKFLGIFKALYNGDFSLDSEEVEDFGFFSLEDIQEMIARGEKFHPELLFLLKKYYNIET